MIPGTPLHSCDFCGFIYAAHEGGITMQDGTEYSGHFCDEDCYAKWRLWRTRFHNFKISLHDVPGEISL